MQSDNATRYGAGHGSIIIGVILAMMLAFFWPAISHSAQPQALNNIVFATGPDKGANQVIQAQLASVCPGSMMEAKVSTGGDSNIALLQDNQANVGLTDMSLLIAYRDVLRQDMSNIQVLSKMYSTQVHIVGRASGQISDITQLGNKRIGYFGSAKITSQIIMGKLGKLAASYSEYATPDAMLKALANNEIDVAIGVGVAPVPWAKAASPATFKLIDVSSLGALGDVFSTSRLSYSIGNVNALSTDAVMITQAYRPTGPMGQAVKALRDCMWAKLPDLVEMTGSHPGWRQVKKGATVKWEMFNGGK